jgi:hypothetical protein
MNKNTLSIAGYVVAAVLVLIGIMYFMTPSDQLPAFMPGYDMASTKVHTKHGLAAVMLALGAVAFSWFQKGPRSPQE